MRTYIINSEAAENYTFDVDTYRDMLYRISQAFHQHCIESDIFHALMHLLEHGFQEDDHFAEQIINAILDKAGW